MTSRLKAIKGGKGGKVATVADLAAIEFVGVKVLVNLPYVKRLKKVHGIVDSIRGVAVLATEIVAMDKPELIAKVSEKYDVFGPFLMELAYARDDASALMDIIGAAEARMAVALAVVEGTQAEKP